MIDAEQDVFDAKQEICACGIHPGRRSGDREVRLVRRQPGRLNGPIYQRHSVIDVSKRAGLPVYRNLMAG